jgi:futalosine hydrolase
MNCLVVAATAAEIKPFLDQYRSGINLPHTTDVLITGIGLTATTYALARQIHIKRPDLVIQAGVAGCFSPSIPLGTVLAVKKESIADQGVIESRQLKSLFGLQLLSQNQYPFSKGWLVNKNGILSKIKLKKVTGISVNEITTSPQKIKLYTHAYAPVVESMEGAALHYVCLMEKIPFIQLRAISNYIAERNKKHWNMKDSIINLNNELVRLLQML